MDLSDSLKANLKHIGYEYPTQIQEESLPHLLEGKNLIGIAKTGTGKTASFLLPIIERKLRGDYSLQSLIVVPTRELALQISDEFKSLSYGLGMHAACFIGGTSVSKDIQKLNRRQDIIIGTPGRLIDLYNRRALRLSKISVLVLDEFDRMLDMGFVNDIKKLTSALKSRKHTMLFSATIDNKQQPIIETLVSDAVKVKVSEGTTASESINQDIIRVPEGGNKFQLLVDLVSDKEFSKVLVFAETKRMVNNLAKRLNKKGVLSDMIHGNKSQNYRVKALKKFKSGNIQVLVATDVAARGIDVDNVSHVINYQLPQSFESYVHRIGRTGRAGKIGQAYTFVN